MQAFLRYITTRKADGFIVDGALADWIAAEQTSGRITGTWAYYTVADRMARMAELLGHADDAAEYEALARNIKAAFNEHFFNSTLHRYTSEGDAGTAGATQAAQALALDEGLVPEGERQHVLDALVELVYAFHPFGGGPHFSGGTIGMAPIVRALSAGGRDDVLWDALQEDTRPSYGFIMAPTAANPGGLTTLPEQWDLGNSKNHMILSQIDEWFHTGLAGIRQAPGSVGYERLVIEPKPVGDLTEVEGSYRTPYGEVTSHWTRRSGRFRLDVEVPPNTTAEVRVPAGGVYRVGSGSHTFTSAS
jgi:alpha-L-rhamnosidase